MELSAVARSLLENRYLLPGETPSRMFSRVAGALRSPHEKEFLAVMKNLLFLPNSPTLMNAGTPDGQLSACFVLPVEDSIEGIFTALLQMALIHKTGGGTGFSFSHLRPARDRVSGKEEVASGPLPFIRVFDEATNALRQGGRRRGANMGVLASSHPDIIEFIRIKQDPGLRNFNLSVGFDRAFFDCLGHGRNYELVNPRDGYVWEVVDSRTLWRHIGEAAWRCGDPGVLFLDRINEANPVPGLGPIEATNPCGEQPLLPFESCNLGSINLSRCVRNGGVDFDLLGSTVSTAVAFLDGVIDVNRFPVPEIAGRTLLTRKIGLGAMGLADAFLLLGIPYESKEALDLAGRIFSVIQVEARAASTRLGEEKGSFPAIDRSMYTGPMRNATVTTVAPTGSLHLIAGTSSGIEPVFSLAYVRVIQGRSVEVVHPLVRKILGEGRNGEKLLSRVERTGSVRDLPVSDDVRDLLRTATEISPEFHVRMQAAVQKHVDNAVSKTVNLPEETGVDEICRIFLLARDLGCKGVTVYRYNSKAEQVLSSGCHTCHAPVRR